MSTDKTSPSNTRYALKEINKSKMEGKSFFVENEVHILKSLQHPNICKLVDAYYTKFAYLLIFELASKGDLFEAIKKLGHFSENTCASIIHQLALALKYLHSNGVIHRDIKPENIFLQHDLTVKLADFDPLLILKTLPYSMDPNKLFDYFCIIGQNSYTNLTELTSNSTPSDPIVEIEVIFPKLDESIPPGFTILASTPNGSTANLNYGTIPFGSCFICYKRDKDLPPITDIGIVDWAKRERCQSGTVSIVTTRKGNCASISNTFLKKLFVVYKRADSIDGSGMIVADICIINESKGDLTPASFFKINKNLNKEMTGTDIFICFRKQYLTNKELKFKANVLDSFPNIQENSIAQELAMFCLPEGVKRCEVNCAGVRDQGSTFILTDGGGSKLYGIGLKILRNLRGFLVKDRWNVWELEILSDPRAISL
uniref:Protein kinase domain-containing protein n=1 Tax=Rhabditophanes sp. KR3021 TaxID=114890 RepID=A0AC35U016_9BILA